MEIIFDDRLKNAREKMGLTVKQAAAMLRLPYTTYNNYEKNTREPSGGLICKMAEFYGVTTDYLLGRTDQPAAPSCNVQDENLKELIEKWNSLDKHGKHLTMLVLDAEYDRCCKNNSAPSISSSIENTITIRSSEYKVSAGTGFLLSDDDLSTELRVPDTPAARKADFALRISGDSMEPIYHDGDIVLVKKADFVRIGEIGIFVVDGSGYIKKYGGDRLISLNNAYNDIILRDGMSAHCCGLVIGRC